MLSSNQTGEIAEIEEEKMLSNINRSNLGEFKMISKNVVVILQQFLIGRLQTKVVNLKECQKTCFLTLKGLVEGRSHNFLNNYQDKYIFLRRVQNDFQKFGIPTVFYVGHLQTKVVNY